MKTKKTNNKKIIGLTFGVFDMFHIGHLNLLKAAKKKCDKLIVCVSSDGYSKKHKNKLPIIPFNERITIIRSIKYVDQADIQSLAFGKKEAVKKYKPDLLFVAGWTPKTYTGQGLGVPVVYLPYTKKTSSTLLKEKLLSK